MPAELRFYPKGHLTRPRVDMRDQLLVAERIKPVLGMRAQRFAIQLPVRYRLRAESGWRRGETINVSSSGVLFCADYCADPGTPTEINLSMPVVSLEGSANVVCRGTVVRTAGSPGGSGRHALAIRILHYRLVRP